MKIPYKANINDFLDQSDDQELGSDHSLNEESDQSLNNESDQNTDEEVESEEEMEDVDEENFQLSSDGKRRKITDYGDQNTDEEEMEMGDAIEQNFQLTSDNKRRKITSDFTDNVSKKKQKFNKDLYKPPTVEELNQLRETENLFHSNLFRLQIEEMLNEIKIKDKYKRLFDLWFEKFQKTVQSIKETEEYEISGPELQKALGGFIHLPNVPKDTKAMFKFLKPSNIDVIGSYVVDAVVGPNINIDLMVEMPSNMFKKQDYQNYRYFKKKAIYLAYIASSITDDIAEMKKFIGDDLRLILKLVPSGKLGKKVTVFIHVSLQDESFKLNRFLPEKNSVRPGWFFENTDDDDLPPTPHYNAIVLHDLTMKVNLESMKMIKQYPNIRDGIILLKVWLVQRGLTKGFDAFNGHIITMFVLYLLTIKKLNTFMSSYQIVRNVWNYLAHSNLYETGITLNQDENDKTRVLDYHKYYECVFLDNTGYHNIIANVSKATYKWIQREAALCLSHLDSAHADSFQSLFMRKVPFYRAFDHLIWFRNATALQRVVRADSNKNNKLNYGPDSRTYAIKIIHNLLKEGLKERVNQICVLPNEMLESECTEIRKNDIGEILIGLELNPEFCFNVVDKGPEANLPEAIEFRNFWGKLSELRRFQDGSIREAVVWSTGKSLAGKRMICKRIVNFLLKQKLGLLKNHFIYIADQMEELLKLPKIKITHFVYGTGEGAALKVINSFNGLEKDLMSLTDVPLSIHGVQGSSPVFRYTDVFPPLATIYRPDKEFIKIRHDCLTFKKMMMKKPPNFVPPLEVNLQLSTSGKWPDELEAFRKTKAAFHIQIAECLRKQYNLVANANYSHVDVYKDGFVFRLRIAHQKEIACVKQQVTEDGVTKYIDNEESIELESKLFELPKLSSALHGLHVQQPSFGATCCLTKRWLSAHLLDDSHIPDVVVELLVASMYLTPAPYTHSQMPQVAFLRILEIFARGHWSTDPVIVNFNNEMTREEIVAVENLFGSSRDTLPPLFISTPYDQQRSLWTRKAPTTLVLNRISSLAKQSLNLFEDLLFQKVLLDFKPLFRPSLTEYDCILNLKLHMVPRRLQAVDIDENYPDLQWHPYKKHSQHKIPITGFDPIQCFLKELRSGYDEFALFFHDTYGGTRIGILFRPSALETKEFKVTNINGRKSNHDGQLVLNISAIIQDFYILGKDLIESIDVTSKRFSLT